MRKTLDKMILNLWSLIIKTTCGKCVYKRLPKVESADKIYEVVENENS